MYKSPLAAPPKRDKSFKIRTVAVIVEAAKNSQLYFGENDMLLKIHLQVHDRYPALSHHIRETNEIKPLRCLNNPSEGIAKQKPACFYIFIA